MDIPILAKYNTIEIKDINFIYNFIFILNFIINEILFLKVRIYYLQTHIESYANCILLTKKIKVKVIVPISKKNKNKQQALLRGY